MALRGIIGFLWVSGTAPVASKSDASRAVRCGRLDSSETVQFREALPRREILVCVVVSQFELGRRHPLGPSDRRFRRWQ